MHITELTLRFIAGGSLVVAVSLLAKARNPVLAGMFMLFPVITLIGLYFIGQSVNAVVLKKITLFSLCALPTTLVFLVTFFLLIGRTNLVLCLFLSAGAWCAAAAAIVGLNHYLFRIGY